MAAVYKSPGVYIEEIPKLPPSVAPVETAIPAFIGYTAKALDNAGHSLTMKPYRITSLVEYEQHFGGADPEGANLSVDVVEITDASAGKTPGITCEVKMDTRSPHNMYYALQMFYANGGGPCWIVSVDAYAALDDDKLKAGIDEIEKIDEPTLLVLPEAQGLSSISEFKSVMSKALDQCKRLQDRFVVMDVHGDSEDMNSPKCDLAKAVDNFRNKGGGLTDLKYGAAYAPNIDTVLDFVLDETKVKASHTKDGGTKEDGTLDGLKAKTQSYAAAKAAIRNQLMLRLPPSAAVAGVYAAVDNDRGVWNAPANVTLNGVIRPTVDITNVVQDGMNVDPDTGMSVNAIRSFAGKGAVVWGARTLAGNDNEWRYVNVRRFFIFAEESLKKATAAFVFQSNDANTWVRVQAMCENFLTVQWRQGALQGAKAEQAFRVSVGLGKTMTAQDILEGRMNIEIAMAVVRPAEFIIMRFSHLMAQA